MEKQCSGKKKSTPPIEILEIIVILTIKLPHRLEGFIYTAPEV